MAGSNSVKPVAAVQSGGTIVGAVAAAFSHSAGSNLFEQTAASQAGASNFADPVEASSSTGAKLGAVVSKQRSEEELLRNLLEKAAAFRAAGSSYRTFYRKNCLYRKFKEFSCKEDAEAKLRAVFL